MKRRLGDRYDVRRLRKLNAFYQITPYIMRNRSDALDYYEDLFDINSVEKWLRSLHERGFKDIGYLQLFMAATVRTISQFPRLNRFVAGQRIYARNQILITLAIKKELHENALETTIKIPFQATDTIFDVASKLNTAIIENKDRQTKNNTDNTARLFMIFPRWFIRLLLWMIRTLDYYNLMPKALFKASPFHTSAFITDLGSLGIKPIYHHIYDFGTTSLFIAFGTKQRVNELSDSGEIIKRKYIPVKIVNDERICDGHYYASAFKYLRQIFKNPQILETPPEKVVEDAD